MDNLKKDLEEAIKVKASAPLTPAPKKTFGISRPSTAVSSKNGAEATPKRNVTTTPMTARGSKKEETNMSTPSKGMT